MIDMNMKPMARARAQFQLLWPYRYGPHRTPAPNIR